MASRHSTKRVGHTPNADINMVPLIDIMLVLVIIFIVTAPLMTHSVRISLPKETSTPTTPRSDRIDISLDRQGNVFWNKEAISWTALEERLTDAGSRGEAPELQLHADEAVAYRHVIKVMSESAKRGVTRIGFVSEPRKN